MSDGAQPAGDGQGDLVLVPGNPPPAGTEIIWYTGADGIRLRMLFVPKEGARGLAIVCPGRTESIEKYFEVMRDLQARNFALLCLDWPGQGLSDRPLKNPIRGHVTTFETYVDALVRAVAVVADRAPARCVVVAHSMGSAITLEALRTGRVTADLAAFSAPMWGIPASSFLQNFARMADKLASQPEGDDTKRRWHDTFLTNAEDLCEMLTHLNVTKDPELERARLALKNAIRDVDMEDIKKDELTRLDVKSKLDTILKAYEW